MEKYTDFFFQYEKKKSPAKSYLPLCEKNFSDSVTISDFISFQLYVRLHGFPHVYPEITGGICTDLTQFYLILTGLPSIISLNLSQF